MEFSLSEAAAATGKGRMTIQRAIKSGRVSATKDERGAYRIDPAELHRVFPPASQDTSRDTPAGRDETARELERIRAELEQTANQLAFLESERRREREQLETTIDDLRRRLDGEANERKRLTHVLTDQRSDQTAQRRHRPWWPFRASA